MRAQSERLSELGAEPVAVGFSPVGPLASLAEHLRWPWPFLSDTERVLYRRLGLPSATPRGVWTPGTKQAYRQARAKGQHIHAPVEDPLQLGGDAVLQAGRVTALWRPASPDDRPTVDELMAALAGAEGRAQKMAKRTTPGRAPFGPGWKSGTAP